MSNDWSEVKLGDVLVLQRGFDLPEKDRRFGAYPVVASTGTVGMHDKAMAQGPGVVIGRSGSLGGGQFIENDFWPLNTTLWVKDFKENHRRFCYYLLKSLNFSQFNVGSGVPTLNRNHIHPILVRLPPIREQRAIAHILGTLDDKIELNRRMNETLEGMARAMFKAWFVDFEPVRAKMEGRWRRGESLAGLPAELYDLFPERLVDSELGEIPEGWLVSCVGSGFFVTMGQSPPGETYNQDGEGVPFYQGRTDFGVRFPQRRVYCNAAKRLAEEGDTLVSVRAPVGDINMANEKCAVGRGVAAVCHKSKSRSYTYYFMLNLKSVFGRFNAEGTVFGSLNKFDFHNIPCAEPPLSAVKLFDSTMSSIENRIKLLFDNIELMCSIRDALLPKLISGELRVKDAEDLVGRAL